MQETTVVNLRKEIYDVSISRGSYGHVPNPPEYGCFGNPFTIARYGREESINLYRQYFYEKIENDAVFKAAVIQLKGKRLGCFCKPLACHGDIIKEWLDNCQ